MSAIGNAPRIGIDLGGTKTEGVVLGTDSVELARRRIATPRSDYDATIGTLAALVAALESECGQTCTVGIGIPGSLSPVTQRVHNANSTWLNGRPLDRDLAAALDRPVRIANDANCFALSEFYDGAGAGAHTLFGVILGTGCGGGLVVAGRIIDGPRGTGGEWGHNPLPAPQPDELPGPQCWCGRLGCMEAWVSGPAMSADHARRTGDQLSPANIIARAEQDDTKAAMTRDRHAGRLARGLATVINVFDPDCVVLGGGLSNLPHLYRVLPDLIAPHIFADGREIKIVPPRWGDASGVRGAARLWHETDSKI